ncbi:MAG: cyclodehydratase [Microthrixaceae bacterium]
MRTALAATCQGTAVGQSQTSALSTGATLLAPATAAAGSTFQAQLTADPIIVPTTGGGYPIQNLNTIKVRFDVPAGATFVSASLNGGSNLGAGTPTVALSGTQVVLSIPGNLAPGTTATLPTVTATFTASGAVGTTLGWKLAGTSYSNPGISFTARVGSVPLFGSINVPTNCYASPNPVLGTTTIS